MESKSKATLKTMIIGLDGATFDLMRPFVEDGRLPNFKYLMEHGAWGELESTYPPVTAAAWPSFMTGENPGKHGILKFVETGKEAQTISQEQRTVSTQSFAGRTFFDALARQGQKVGAITIPVTYPPWDINGVMISGYPCPDNEKIYSVDSGVVLNLSEPLNFGADYYKTASESQILEDCIYRDRLRADLTFDLLEKYAFDSFTLVLGGVDRACHDYWKYHDSEYPGVSDDLRSKFKDAIFRNYALGDEQIGRFLEKYGDSAHLFVLSDHGSGRHPFHAFNANVWLKKQKFLHLAKNRALPREILRKIFHRIVPLITPKDKKTSPLVTKLRNRGNKKAPVSVGERFSKIIDWKRTKAFYYTLMYPIDGIMINLKGRQVNGIVSPGKEYEQLVKDLIKKLLESRDPETGEALVEAAFTREEVYSGDYVDRFPDIIYRLNPKYIGAFEVLGKETMPVPSFRLSKKSGVHLMNGVFMAYGPDIRPQKIAGANIIDVAPTVLYCSDQAIPENMDGRVLEDIFDEAVLNGRPVRQCNFQEAQINGNYEFNEQENEEMKEKLRSLGYID